MFLLLIFLDDVNDSVHVSVEKNSNIASPIDNELSPSNIIPILPNNSPVTNSNSHSSISSFNDHSPPVLDDYSPQIDN